jgi:hypothetical protein
MTAGDWVTVIGGIGSIYLLWQQNQIFKTQNEIIAAQSKRTAVQPSSASTFSLKRYWPTFIMLLLIALTGYDIYDRHSGFGYDPDRAWSDSMHPVEVPKHTFENETIVLDGKSFPRTDIRQCNVRFQWAQTFLDG